MNVDSTHAETLVLVAGELEWKSQREIQPLAGDIDRFSRGTFGDRR